MAALAPISLASIIIGFISFSITLLTLLGVYRDLISTLRSAGKHIPITLANLRQEILFEKAFVSRRVKHGDDFHVFPKKLCYVKLPNGQWVRTKKASANLLEATIRDLWTEFKMLERPFLIRSDLRAKAVAKGDYWGEEDVQEKPRRGLRRGRGRREAKAVTDEEAQEDAEGEIGKHQGYYKTDLSHRWIWWHTKADVDNLMNQVQRLQIRRMERDLYETDELVKRLVRSGGDEDERTSGSGSGNSSDGGSRRRSVAGVGMVRSRVGSRGGSVRGVRIPPSRRGSGVGRGVREVVEREIVRRPAGSPRRERQSEMEASNTGRRRDRRDLTVEYEVLRPGSVYVDPASRPRRGQSYVEDTRSIGRRRSYSRERER